MTSIRDVVLLPASLLLFWVMLNGSLAPDVLAVGVVASLVISFLFRDGIAIFAGLRASPRTLVAAAQYVIFFLKELIKSNIGVARIVFTPALPVNPGIVKVRTRLKSPIGRALLANSITLTPGTLTVEMQGEWLYIHWVSVDDPDIEGATAAIVAGFERYLEVMYG